ncbi:MAG: type II toxin-antitoxin system RelE/ParE family toxin [Balneolaceae bacterium]
MAEIIWTEPALQSLDEIADYISLDNPNAASELVHSVFSTIELLKDQPLLGREIPELELSIYREVIVSPCRIFYQVEREVLLIVHIQREEQNFRNPFY